jgi:2-keto-4-pentenoate hydratase/2-oxohepta-3-ene-1,7-dioic acid hydratase in catechol pathway
LITICADTPKDRYYQVRWTITLNWCFQVVVELFKFESKPAAVTYSRAGMPATTGLLTSQGDVLNLITAGDLSGLYELENLTRLFGTMQCIIDGGEQAHEVALEILERFPEDAIEDASAIRLLAPLPRPRQIRCFSSFEKHGRQSAVAMMETMAQQSDDPASALEELKASGRFEIPEVVFERPFYYKGNRMSVVGPDAEIKWPPFSDLVDYELEIAAVIGKQGVNISREEANGFLFGYSIFNDLSARDVQARDMALPLGPSKSKDFDGGNVMGPCIVTADELIDPYSLTMIVRVSMGRSGEGGGLTICCLISKT